MSKTKVTSRVVSAIPRSRAKTAYGLLGEIAKLIVEEPKRYDQEETLAKVGHAERNFPTCGTVGCVAGWVVALKVPLHTSRSFVTRTATSILGIDERQADHLFYSMPPPSALPQTARHAKWGANHIEQFRKAHRAQLLKTALSSSDAQSNR